MFDPTIQSENIAFERSELIICGKCSRQNAPNRSSCIYCGSPLNGVSAKSSKNSQQVEVWEPGFNVVVIRSMDGSELILPDSRVATLAEAESIATQLLGSGKNCRVISDELLNANELPLRISALRFDGDALQLIDFNTRNEFTVNCGDIVLLVSGRIIRTRSERLEKRRRKADTKVIDAVDTSEDEPVLDLYVRGDARGFRINVAGFDYSCLGESMGFLAVENIKKLALVLRESLPNLKVVNDYPSVKHQLDNIWPIESHDEATGLQRSGFGRVEFGKTSSSSNLRQFTLYSRLQYLCYER